MISHRLFVLLKCVAFVFCVSFLLFYETFVCSGCGVLGFDNVVITEGVQNFNYGAKSTLEVALKVHSLEFLILLCKAFGDD